MLVLDQVEAGYGAARILHGLSFGVQSGEILCLLGRNGAGKTTALKTIMGALPLRAGNIVLDGNQIGGLPPHDRPRLGIGYVPQGRRLFAELSVAENLEIGLMARGKGKASREQALELFPRLRERLRQRAETLSGGEQQMLATARALCLEPRLLLLDEPTEGLQPSMIAQIRDVILHLRQQGVAILLVEQRIEAVLAIADRVVFIENGRGREALAAATLRQDRSLLTRYLGV